MKNNNYKKGYSIIETLAYATFMAIIVAIIAYATNALFIAHKKIKAARQIENSVIASLDRIVRDIRAASDISSISGESSFGVSNGFVTLTIPNAGGNTAERFYLSGGKILLDNVDVLTRSRNLVGQLSLSDVQVTALKFSYLTSAATSPHSKAIKVEITMVGKGQDAMPVDYVYYNNLDDGGATGKISAARTFNGGSPITGSSVQLGDTFTYTLWMKRSNLSVNGYQTLLSKGNNSPAIVLMGETGAPYPAYASQIGMSKYFVDDAAFSQAKINDTGWHHVALVKSGATRSVYIDGNPSTILATDQTMSDVNTAMIIGLGFEGTIDEVRVYNYALTASQIKAVYNYTGYTERFYATAVMRGSIN